MLCSGFARSETSAEVDAKLLVGMACDHVVVKGLENVHDLAVVHEVALEGVVADFHASETE